MAGLEKRSFSIAGHRTSVALEPEFWAVLERAALERAAGGQALSALVVEVDAARAPDNRLASALRLRALAFAALR